MNSLITFRPINDGDVEFLFEVYASTRIDFAVMEVDDATKRALLVGQFRAQHSHYQRYFPRAQFDIILADAQPVGRLYVHRDAQEIRVIDITLLPEHRNRGLGAGVMKTLLDESDRVQKPIRLRVEPFNPSLRLFQRFGFVKIADEEANWHMERKSLPRMI